MKKAQLTNQEISIYRQAFRFKHLASQPLFLQRYLILTFERNIKGMRTNRLSGIGFAIPYNAITKIVPILIDKGYYPHAYLHRTSLLEDTSVLVNWPAGN